MGEERGAKLGKGEKKFEKTEVRIVAGKLKGRRIACYVNPDMRPTPQLVRESLFSIMGNAIPGRLFYDVFAGTGVVGMEAVSRGALRANLIEFDAKQATEIQGNINRFGIAESAVVLRADAYKWAERWIVPPDQKPVNLFLSPPFPDLAPERIPPFLKMVMDLMEKAPLESVLILQTEDGFPFDQLPHFGQWDIRKYGRNFLGFYVKEATPEPGTPVPG